MCGRYTLSVPSDAVADLFGLEQVEELPARFNIAPSQTAPVVIQSDGDRRLFNFRWGLVPFWAKDPSIGNRMINARSETVAEKPAFRSSFKRRRCLVIADGFYEWQATNGPKQPYFFRLESSAPFGMAGLWDRWDKDSEENPLSTFTILTTEPNALVEAVHRRMPVILPPSQFGPWLDPENQDSEDLLQMLASYPAGDMTGYPVSTYVNNPGNDGPRCIAPIESS